MGEFEYETFQISLNGTNLLASDPSNAVYEYTFPGSIRFEHAKVALSQCNIYFSWYNISLENDNNTYDFTFTTGAGTSTYTVTMPDGYYTVADLNTFLQSVCIDNGLYLVDSAGDFVYYIEILENPTFYSIQLNNYAFPTALPAGWTNPNALTFPVTAQTTQFIIPATNIQNLLGFNAATIPSPIQTTTTSTLSDFTPQIDTVQSLFVALDLINNTYSNPPSILYPFSAAGSGGFGSLISVEPSNLLYLNVNPGYYRSFRVTFLDQAFNKVPIRDTNLIVQLSFIVKREA